MTSVAHKHRPWRIPIIVLASVLLLAMLILSVGRAYFRLPVRDYYRASEKAFRIPGLSDGFIPQGLAYDWRTDSFFMTGYDKDGEASPVYVVDRAEGELQKTVLLGNEDGTAFTGHAGGLALHGQYVYVAGGAEYCLYVFSYDDVLRAENGTTVCALGRFSTGNAEDGIRVSCVTAEENRIWVAEFYHEPKYPTPESHKMTTAAGEYQQALAVAYEFSDGEASVFGIDPQPTIGYSLPDKVQGMAFENGYVYLSSSYGVSFSHIWEYDRSKAAYQTDLSVQGVSIPVYALDSAARTKDMKIAPMSEEIVFVEGRYYTMCESASEKYWFGKLTSAYWCYATDPNQMNGE